MSCILNVFVAVFTEQFGIFSCLKKRQTSFCIPFLGEAVTQEYKIASDHIYEYNMHTFIFTYL